MARICFLPKVGIVGNFAREFVAPLWLMRSELMCPESQTCEPLP